MTAYAAPNISYLVDLHSPTKHRVNELRSRGRSASALSPWRDVSRPVVRTQSLILPFIQLSLRYALPPVGNIVPGTFFSAK